MFSPFDVLALLLTVDNFALYMSSNDYFIFYQLYVMHINFFQLYRWTTAYLTEEKKSFYVEIL